MSISSDMLNKTAVIYTKSQSTKNDFGEYAFTEAESISSVSVALQSVKEELSFTLHGTTYVARHLIYCNYRTDITPGDVAEIESIKYRIISVENDGGRDHHIRMYAVRV